MVLVFCAPDIVVVVCAEFSGDELWFGNYRHDIVIAFGDVAINAQVICINDGDAENAAGNGAHSKIIRQ